MNARLSSTTQAIVFNIIYHQRPIVDNLSQTLNEVNALGFLEIIDIVAKELRQYKSKTGSPLLTPSVQQIIGGGQQSSVHSFNIISISFLLQGLHS